MYSSLRLSEKVGILHAIDDDWIWITMVYFALLCFRNMCSAYVVPISQCERHCYGICQLRLTRRRHCVDTLVEFKVTSFFV